MTMFQLKYRRIQIVNFLKREDKMSQLKIRRMKIVDLKKNRRIKITF